jgi:glycosidase
MSEFSGETNSKIILYQIFTRLFGNQTQKPLLNGTKAENGSGTFEDISEKALQSIENMGFTHIWLTGIIRHATQTDNSEIGFPPSHPATVKGMAGSPYAISDYFELDPDLAKNPEKRWEEFFSCRDRIQKAGLKLIVDFVPNHTARQYKSAYAESQGFGALGEKDFKHEWFHPNHHYFYIPERPLVLPDRRKDGSGLEYQEFPAKATGNDCFTDKPSVYDWYETVKLNYGVNYHTQTSHFDPIPSTWFYMLEVLLFWAEKGIDGFRCDMVEMVPVEFWAWAIPKAKEKYPNLIFIAEVYNPDNYQRYLNWGKFDFLYDKVGLYDCLRDLVEEKGNAQSITRVWQSQEGFEHRMLRFMENHDEQRIASDLVGKDPFRAIPAMAISAFLGKGPLMVYFGQELGEKAVGEAGFSGDDGKTTIFDYWVIPAIQKWQNKGAWNEDLLNQKEKELRHQYRQIIGFARNQPVISQGRFFDLQYANLNNPNYHGQKQFAFIRFLGKDKYLFVQSFLPQKSQIRLIVPQEAWYTLNIETSGRALLKDAFQEENTIEFFVKTSFESEGNAAGILMGIEAWSHKVWKLEAIL